jgi:hypothetical protein
VSAQTFERMPAPPWWREHWLENCGEFRVERGGETIGFVEAIEEAEEGAVAALLVESQTRHVRVSVAEVDDVDPVRFLVTLKP